MSLREIFAIASAFFTAAEVVERNVGSMGFLVMSATASPIPMISIA